VGFEELALRKTGSGLKVDGRGLGTGAERGESRRRTWRGLQFEQRSRLEIKESLKIRGLLLFLKIKLSRS
jgi:hypothetical protein